MALAVSGFGHFDELRVLLHLPDRRASAVSHRRPQATRELEDRVGQGPLVRNPPLDPLGDELREAFFNILEITVAAPLLHRLERAHPAVHLVAPPFEQDLLARAFVHSGEEVSHHDAVGPGRARLRDIASPLASPVGGYRDLRASPRPRTVIDGRPLRRPPPRDDARGADRPRADALLDA